MNSKIMDGSVRPKIFEQWPKNSNRYPDRPNGGMNFESRKKNESLIAEETLFKTLMLEENIRNYLYEKDRLKKKSFIYITKSNELRKELELLSIETGEKFDENEYELKLKDYFIHIGQEENFLTSCQTFCFANLANHDKNISTMNSKKEHKSNQKELEQKLKELKEKRNRVQEALVIYEQGIPGSQILTTEFNLDRCMEDLVNFTSNEKLIEIHYLMFYEISETEQWFNNMLSHVKKDKESYLIFEALYDSIVLMSHQSQQMEKDRHRLKTMCSPLTFENATSLIPQFMENLTVLEKNNQLYISNSELFARYNAETNLNEYSNRRKVYVSELEKYTEAMKKSKLPMEKLNELFRIHKVLENFRKVQGIKTSRMFPQNKNTLREAYYNCLSCGLEDRCFEKKSLEQIPNYKKQLLLHLEQTMESANVVVPGGLVGHWGGPLGEKLSQFFVELEKKPISLKAPFLDQELERVNALKYELSNSNSNNNTLKQQIGLELCAAIGRNERRLNISEYQKEVQRICDQEWRNLPIGINSLIFFYSYDIFLINECYREIYNKFENKMKNMNVQMYQELMKFSSNMKGEKKIKDLLLYDDVILKTIQLSAQERRDLFYSFYRKVSDYCLKPKENLQYSYWKIAEKYIVEALVKSNLLERRTEVQKKYFFTFGVLSFLATEGSKLQVSNTDELIEYYIKYATEEEFYKWEENKLFLEIIKQRILLDFMKEKSVNFPEFKQEINVLEKVNEAFQIQLEINDHLDLSPKEDTEVSLELAAKLQRSWENLLKESETIETSNHLANGYRSMLKSVTRPLLNFGTRASIVEIEPLLNIQGKLSKLKLLPYLQDKFGFISVVYTRCYHFLTIMDSFSENLSESNTLSMANNSKHTVYLSHLKQKGSSDLLLLQQKLLEIMNIYRGKNPRQNGQNRISSSTTENERALEEIINKLMFYVQNG